MKSPSVTDFRCYFLSLGRYHVWASERLCEKVNLMPEDDYRRDAGLFFKSVHGTLNHLVVAEHRAWYPRFAEGQSNRVALNLEVERDRARLRALLLELTARWGPLIESMDEARFLGKLDYLTTQACRSRCRSHRHSATSSTTRPIIAARSPRPFTRSATCRPSSTW